MLQNPFLQRSVSLVFFWLIIVNIFAIFSFNRLNVSPDTAFEWMTPQSVRRVPQSWDIIELHNRWDAYWYLDIAQNGYYLRGDDVSNVVFFPLYPLLMRITAPVVGGNLVLAGWILSCGFLFLAVAEFIKLTREFHPELDPLLPAVFLLVHPLAFFLNAVYSESLFLFLSLAMMRFTLRKQYLPAAVFCAFASATRIAGVFLMVPLCVEFIQENGWRALFSRRALPLFLAPSGAFLFFCYHWVAFGDFFLYLRGQEPYGRDFVLKLSDFFTRNGPDLANTMIDLSYTVVSLMMGIIALKKFRPSYGLYMLVSLAVAISSGTVLGIGRYAMMFFPIYFIAAGIRSHVGRGAWLFGSALLLAMNIICFANHYWAD
jgi:hypothetical protein